MELSLRRHVLPLICLLGGKYDHFMNKKWFLYSGLGFEHDKFADLTLRTTASVGSGCDANFQSLVSNDRLLTRRDIVATMHSDVMR